MDSRLKRRYLPLLDGFLPDPANQGPEARATFSLGLEALEQADRLARIASVYQAGGVSRSTVIRGLLKFAEEIALQSGDAAVATVLANRPPPESGKLPSTGKSTPDQARLWQAIRAGILAS